LPHVSSKAAVVSGSASTGSWVNRTQILGVDVSALVVDEFEGGSVGQGPAGEVVWEAEVDPALLLETVDLFG
jgi:hypothetical protein